MLGTASQRQRAPDPAARSRAVYAVAGLAILWFLLGIAGVGFQGRLSTVQRNDNSSFLPTSAESTKVADEAARFDPVQTIPAFVVYSRPGGLTPADRVKIEGDRQAIAGLPGVAEDRVLPATIKDDAAFISAPLISKQQGRSVDSKRLSAVEEKVLALAQEGAPSGLQVYAAGPGGLLVAIVDAFQGVEGVLLLAAGAVVVLILLVVYRSPVLWFFPLLCSLLALTSAALIIYPLAEHGVLTLNGQNQGVLSVLVIGAGTDYALLLVSRYREELHRTPGRVLAMSRAWRGAAPAIVASGVTVVVGLLCLMLGALNSDRSLGPVCAIGIGCTVLVMLTVLPVLLVVCGRWIFWPKVPKLDQKSDVATHGAWSRFARGLARHHRRYWLLTAAALVLCALAITQLRTQGLPVTESFTNTPDAIRGQQVFDREFGGGSGTPAVVVTDLDAADAVMRAARAVPGVQDGPGSVCRAVDYAKVAVLLRNADRLPTAAGCPPSELWQEAKDGRVIIDVTLPGSYDSPQAKAALHRLRAAVHDVPGAHALVGGSTAVNFDVQQAARHDRNLIIPVVLGVILVVLALLLRAVVAPLLLIGTVVLSFTATLGVCALVFNHLFGFANADASFPLYAFVFLVALGIDYNIFLMTRVREETLRHGTAVGITRGLTMTGGVITSAGAVLAATFAVLSILPLVALAQIGFAVAFGILLDTLVVRSILVPAVGLDIGASLWWPSRLAQRP
jgi:RND superfamily putative drug exporter